MPQKVKINNRKQKVYRKKKNMNTLNKVFKVESREGELSGFVAAAADFEVVFHGGGKD